ncbi:MAG: AAA family ATPase [Umezawaea sp.]
MSGGKPLIPRERLFALLDGAVAAAGRPPPVTLVQAPTGAGKSALLATWCARRVGNPDTPGVVRVSLQSWHGHPAALYDAVCEALGPSDIGLVPRPRRSSVAVPPVCLVLDNAHELTGRPAAYLVAMLARQAPLRLVLAGRSAPLRPWLRARGRLREIRAEDLAFTPAEAVELLRAHGVPLRTGDVDELLHRTRGFAAALRLAVTSVNDRGGPPHR